MRPALNWPLIVLAAAFGLLLNSCGRQGALKAAGPETEHAKRGSRTRIVLIGHAPDHPFGSHMYLHECGLLAKCLNETAGVDAVVSDRWPRDPAVLDNVKGIVFYSSPAANLMLE